MKRNLLKIPTPDLSCHEPDTFVPLMSVRDILLKDWRWKLLDFSTKKSALSPEFAPEFDGSSWNKLNAKNCLSLTDGQKAVYRTHIKLTEEDLSNPGLLVKFSTIDDHG